MSKELTDCELYLKKEFCPRDCEFRHIIIDDKNKVCEKWNEGKCEDLKCSNRHPKKNEGQVIVFQSQDADVLKKFQSIELENTKMKAEYEKEMLKRDLELVRLKDEMKLKLDHSNQINELKLELAKAQNQTENEKNQNGDGKDEKRFNQESKCHHKWNTDKSRKTIFQF